MGNLFASKFKEYNVEIERAYRGDKRNHIDSKGNAIPCQISVKFLRFTDKVHILRRQCICLADEDCCIVEDITAIDLEKKKRWSMQVDILYKEGVRLEFISGMRCDLFEKPAVFYDNPNALISVNGRGEAVKKAKATEY